MVGKKTQKNVFSHKQTPYNIYLGSKSKTENLNILYVHTYDIH